MCTVTLIARLATSFLCNLLLQPHDNDLTYLATNQKDGLVGSGLYADHQAYSLGTELLHMQLGPGLPDGL
jgi:hypothetical protein